jgi:hypothetical protein
LREAQGTVGTQRRGNRQRMKKSFLKNIGHEHKLKG